VCIPIHFFALLAALSFWQWERTALPDAGDMKMKDIFSPEPKSRVDMACFMVRVR
jgi:hypothetical protein